jgi:hypothetical protein
MIGEPVSGSHAIRYYGIPTRGNIVVTITTVTETSMASHQIADIG